MICHPVEGMLIECTTKTITKAGIHAEVLTEDDIVPVTVFIARDHHNTNKYFNSIKENMKIMVKVLGVRFELNDSYICAIGQLQDPDMGHHNQVKHKKIRIVGGVSLDENDDDKNVFTGGSDSDNE